MEESMDAAHILVAVLTTARRGLAGMDRISMSSQPYQADDAGLQKKATRVTARRKRIRSWKR
jgi:hypothetical protein